MLQHHQYKPQHSLPSSFPYLSPCIIDVILVAAGRIRDSPIVWGFIVFPISPLENVHTPETPLQWSSNFFTSRTFMNPYENHEVFSRCPIPHLEECLKTRCHRTIDDGSSSVANGRKESSRDDLVGESARAL
ncbi:hypothetical protein TNCV_4450531 [Trichonephila clavipes]|nr:hypothetical protein TNCV_4450531 [Trichonephila clavipes]